MLTVNQIEEVRADFAQELSNARRTFNATKPQCINVLVKVDQWVEDNSSSFLQIIPQVLTSKQGLRLLRAIVDKRMEQM